MHSCLVIVSFLLSSKTLSENFGLFRGCCCCCWSPDTQKKRTPFLLYIVQLELYLPSAIYFSVWTLTLFILLTIPHPHILRMWKLQSPHLSVTMHNLTSLLSIVFEWMSEGRINLGLGLVYMKLFDVNISPLNIYIFQQCFLFSPVSWKRKETSRRHDVTSFPRESLFP